jgi:hypothetical protein
MQLSTIVPNRYGSTTQEQTVWYISAGKSIHLIQGWAVPPSELAKLGLKAHHEAYLTSNGYWSDSYESALSLLNFEPNQSLLIRGNCLSIFVAPEWAEDWGNPQPLAIYQLTRNTTGWDCEPHQPELVAVKQSDLDYF